MNRNSVWFPANALVALFAAACGSNASHPASNSVDASTDASSALHDASAATDAPQPISDAGVPDSSSSSSDGSSVDSSDATAISIPPLPPGCSQSLADKTTPPTTTAFIFPAKPVTPFYQWINNNGYCGEVSMIQAGLNSGQWTSQFNARLLCGGATDAGQPLLQSGPDADCDENAQLLVDNVSPDNAATCLTNFGLANTIFDFSTEASGTGGYQAFMSWIKARTIAGDNVTIGVLDSNGSDSEYDHIVSIVKIGTNHAVTDSTYYDDDVLYFDDHGLLTFENGADTNNPGVPPGTGSDTTGCTPYVFGYSFSELASTAAAAHASGAHAYSIVIPGSGDNYGFAVSGPLNATDLLPVTVALTGSSTSGTANVDSPLVGYNYENPIIGAKDDGTSCTNAPPPSWMTLSLQVTVSGLTAGTKYNLYEYEFDSVSGLGAAAALALPTSSWNANASKATATIPFTATGPTFAYEVPSLIASQTVVFRAVAASAP